MAKTSQALLLGFFLLFPWYLAGCSDELLPPTIDENTRTYYVVDRENPGVYPVRSDGVRGEKIPLPGYLVSPLSDNGRAAVADNDSAGKVRVVELPSGATIATLDDLDGSGVSPYSVSISPDGKRVGFSSIRVDGTSIAYKLHLVDVDGSNRVIVDAAPGNGQVLRFSPDGSQVAFFDGYRQDSATGGIDKSGTLYIVSTSNGAKRKLIETERLESDGSVDIQWSPDGKSILYAVPRGSGQGAWLVDVASGNQTRIQSNYSQFDWSDDGEKFVLSTFEDLLVYQPDQLNTPVSIGIPQPVFFPRLLPGGKEVVGYLLKKDINDFELEDDQVDLVRISLENAEITVIAPQQDVWYLFSSPTVEQ